MAEYCTAAEVKKRATANGYRLIADRDGDGRLNAQETSEVTYAIQWAGNEIDVALAQRLEPDDARAQSNAYLRDIAVDLALYRLFSNGGDDVPRSVELGALHEKMGAFARLDAIKGGGNIPGLTYNPPYNSLIPARVPRAYMPR